MDLARRGRNTAKGRAALLRFRKLRHEADHDALQQERVLLDSMTARRREFAGA